MAAFTAVLEQFRRTANLLEDREAWIEGLYAKLERETGQVRLALRARDDAEAGWRKERAEALAVLEENVQLKDTRALLNAEIEKRGLELLERDKLIAKLQQDLAAAGRQVRTLGHEGRALPPIRGPRARTKR